MEVTPWDAAEYLKTPEDLADYIELVLEEDKDSPAMMAHTIALAARARGGIAQLAAESGILASHLSRAMEQRDESALSVLQSLQRTYQTLAATPKVA